MVLDASSASTSNAGGGGSEVGPQVGEAVEDEQAAGTRGIEQVLVLEAPRVGMGDEDGVEAGGERGVDVGPGGVADHPGQGRVEADIGDELVVGVDVLLGDDGGVAEVGAETRAVDLGRPNTLSRLLS